MIVRASVLSALVVALLAGLSPPVRGQCSGPTCHTVSGNLSDATTGPLLSGHVYVVAGSVTVPSGATLTVEPGAIVKVQSGMFFSVQGTLVAQGTAVLPVRFTSSRDDTAGGDTNGDGGATVPAPGNWVGLTFGAGAVASVLERVVFRYSGSGASGRTLHLTPGMTVEHLTIADGNGDGIYVHNASATIRFCHFENLGRPIAGLVPNAVDNLEGNTGSGNSQGEIVQLYQSSNPSSVTASVTWSATNTLNGTGAIVLGEDLTIPTTVTLTWGPGLVLKLNQPSRTITVNGTLLALGSAGQPIVVTSIHDGDHGSVTSAGSPARGDWRSVIVNSGSPGNSEFRHVVMRYGGEQGGGMLRLFRAVAIEDSTFEASASAGVSVEGAPPTVVDSVFLDNAEEPISAVPIAALAGFSGNTAADNGSGDVIVLGGGTLTTPATLMAASAFNGTGTFVLEGSTQVGAGGRLTVLPGVIFKGKPASGSELRALSGGELIIGGTGTPVVFTSLLDDTWGGDTNADGGATTPAPGNWSGLRLLFASDASVVRNTLVRYAGGNAIWLVGTDATLEDVTVELASGAALFGGNDSRPTVTDCAFISCGGVAPVHGIPLDGLPKLSGNTASGNLPSDTLRVASATVTASLALAPSMTLNGDGVIVVDALVNASGAGVTLTLDAGMALKFLPGRWLDTQARLLCNGTAAEPVVFTSFDDDWGGDTDGNGGAASQGTPGAWRQISIGLQSSGSALTHVRLRNAGEGNIASLLLSSGFSNTLDHVTVERGLSVGLQLTAGTPVVTNCAFNDNNRPVEGVRLTQIGGFSANTASGNALGDVLRLSDALGAPVTNWSLTRAMSLNASGVFRVQTSWSLSTNQNLTIGPGVVLKWAASTHKFDVMSRLLVQGTAAEPVVMTSRHDDDFGGPDDDPTAPQPGDWTGLRFLPSSDASVVEHAIIRYAGNGGTPSVILDGADVTLSNLLIEKGAGSGLDTGGNSAPVLSNVAINDNAGDPIEGLTWNVLGNMSGVTAEGNGSDFDTVIIESPLVTGEVTIEQENLFGPCVVVMVSPATSSANTLSFGRGLVVKAGLPTVGLSLKHVRGTGLEPVVFTSILDDEWGGDTNGDGAASAPGPGDWIGISASGGGAASGASFEHALVRYAGAAGGVYAPVGIFGGGTQVDPPLGSAPVSRSRVEFSAGGGVLAGTCESVVAFANAGVGIRAALARNCTAARNGGTGIHASHSVYCVSWNNGPTLDENYFEIDGPQIGCAPCVADIAWSLGTDLTVSPPVQGAPGLFGCPNTGWGNADVDPRFVDELAGDLRLRSDSPAVDYALLPCPPWILSDIGMCKPWGPEGQGYPDAPAGSRDQAENPRRVDATLTPGAPRVADLGALERVSWRLEADGESVLGGEISLGVQGPAGAATLVIGFPGATDLFLASWGYLAVDPLALLLVGPLPTGLAIDVLLPADAGFLGLEVAVQAAVAPTGPPGAGQLTNVYRPVLHL